MADTFKEFEAESLFCVKCKRATPVRKRLLLVLPTGNKYDYICSACGAAVGGKTDNDATDFYRTTPPPAGLGGPAAPRGPGPIPRHRRR
jgi:hypothetical protein